MILFWTAILSLTTLLYVLLDGFDLGVGILFGLTRNEDHKRRMLAAISPVWDGNETWLVLAGAILFGAFPKVYATLLSAFYLPIILMLGALIFRGVAFEFRYKATWSRPLWDAAFFGGSLVATFVQGMTIGALVKGLPMAGGEYNGGPFGWFSPFACLCGAGLCLGYMMLGVGWLIAKCEGRIREVAYQQLSKLTLAVFGFLVLVFAFALVEQLRIMERWLERPYLAFFPAIGAIAATVLIRATRRRSDLHPIIAMAVIFTAAFGTLAASFWPYMIPFAVTIQDAASPPESLNFMFWGAGLIVVPLILSYTVVVYRVFRGKILDEAIYE